MAAAFASKDDDSWMDGDGTAWFVDVDADGVAYTREFCRWVEQDELDHVKAFHSGKYCGFRKYSKAKECTCNWTETGVPSW